MATTATSPTPKKLTVDDVIQKGECLLHSFYSRPQYRGLTCEEKETFGALLEEFEQLGHTYLKSLPEEEAERSLLHKWTNDEWHWGSFKVYNSPHFALLDIESALDDEFCPKCFQEDVKKDPILLSEAPTKLIKWLIVRHDDDDRKGSWCLNALVMCLRGDSEELRAHASKEGAKEGFKKFIDSLPLYFAGVSAFSK
jgi:hypothetical protein